MTQDSRSDIVKHVAWIAAGGAGSVQLEQRSGSATVARTWHVGAESLSGQIARHPEARADVGVNVRRREWAGSTSFRACSSDDIQTLSAVRIDIDALRPLSIVTVAGITEELAKDAARKADAPLLDIASRAVELAAEAAQSSDLLSGAEHAQDALRAKVLTALEREGLKLTSKALAKLVTCTLRDAAAQPTSEAEYQAAIAAGVELASWASSKQLAEPLVIGSGNGCHVWFPVQPTPLTSDNREFLHLGIGELERLCRERVESQGSALRVDRWGGFAATTRLAGMQNRKGREWHGRQHRTSYIVQGAERDSTSGRGLTNWLHVEGVRLLRAQQDYIAQRMAEAEERARNTPIIEGEPRNWGKRCDRAIEHQLERAPLQGVGHTDTVQALAAMAGVLVRLGLDDRRARLAVMVHEAEIGHWTPRQLEVEVEKAIDYAEKKFSLGSYKREMAERDAESAQRRAQERASKRDEQEPGDDAPGSEEPPPGPQEAPEDPDPEYTPQPPDIEAQSVEGWFNVCSHDDFVGMSAVVSSTLPPIAYWREDWYLWTGTHYDRLPTPELHALARPLVNRCRVFNEKKQKYVPVNASNALIANVVSQLQATPGVLQPEASDAPFKRGHGGYVQTEDGFDPTFIAARPSCAGRERSIEFTNGVLDVDTMQLTEHDSAVFSTGCLGTDFAADEQCPAWLGMLNDQWASDPNSIALLQEWLGYCMVQWNAHHKIMLLHGAPRGGKGIITRVALELLKHYACQSSLAHLGTNFGLQQAHGKRVMVMPDVRWGAKVDADAVLSKMLELGGGDGSVADRKNKSSVRVAPLKVFAASNELPTIPDRTGALAGRLLVLNFKNSFLGREDIGLEKRIQAELRGIAAWAVQGLRRLIERGEFSKPADSNEMREAVIDAGAPVRMFFKSECEFSETYSVSKAEVRSAYMAFCKANGYGALSAVNFGKALHLYARELGTPIGQSQPRKDGKQVLHHVGFQLKPQTDAVSSSDITNIKSWLSAPSQPTEDRFGNRSSERFTEETFTGTDIMLLALGIPKERQPLHEDRVRRVLNHLGYFADEEGRYAMPKAGAPKSGALYGVA